MKLIMAGIVMAFVLALSPAAQAEMVRIPKEGSPAFAFDAPPGWRIVYDAHNNLQFFNSANSVMLQLNVMSGQEMVGASLEDLATAVLRAGTFPTYTSQQAGTISGRAGRTFSTSKPANGIRLITDLTLVRLDETHVATLTRMKRSDVKPTATAALETLAAEVKLTGVK